MKDYLLVISQILSIITKIMALISQQKAKNSQNKIIYTILSIFPLKR